MTADELDTDAIRARAQAATEGPWYEDRGLGSFEYRIHGHDGWRVLSAEDVDPQRASLNAAFLAHARTDVPALLGAVDAAEGEVARLREEVERFRPLWASPLSPPTRWVSEPIPYPRRYVSTFDVLKTYGESIRCSSDWPAESRHEAMDKALHSIPDLAYEIDYLRQDLDETRAKRDSERARAHDLVAAVKALAESLELAESDCGSCSQRLGHAARLRSIIDPPPDMRTCGCRGIPRQVCDDCQRISALVDGDTQTTETVTYDGFGAPIVRDGTPDHSEAARRSTDDGAGDLGASSGSGTA